MSVEYVYSLSEFVAAHDDDLPFSAGERIEVINKNATVDGRWKGRNAAGQVGLFSPSYTAPASDLGATDAASQNESSPARDTEASKALRGIEVSTASLNLGPRSPPGAPPPTALPVDQPSFTFQGDFQQEFKKWIDDQSAGEWEKLGEQKHST